ncbi:hypothetical protein Patl1_35999 [Pistacia atlantica]|nr:hypothetical protein Patl1_35999 [Pistacia atlantica]
MGCVASKLEEEEVVSICRERKRQLKLAVERRYALAEAHSKYSESLYAVSAAIKLFVARHSSPSSPFLITFPPTCPSPPPLPIDQNVINNPMFLQQTSSESTNHEAVTCELCDSDSSTSSESCDEETKEEEVMREDQQQACKYFYMQMPPAMPSPQRDFGWDFFNPFDGMRAEVISGYRMMSDEDVKVVREREGIPELEEEEDNREEEETVMKAEENNVRKEVEESGVGALKVVEGANVNSQEEPKGLTVIDGPENGRELLEALKDIEDHFLRAYDSGKAVSKMLEVNRVHWQSNVEEIKENSTKLMQAITWNRSTSSKHSACKSLVASSSKTSASWTEFKNVLFDEYGGMDSGSHSSTLERLYAWEKKLFEQVKAGDDTRKLYERKCSRLRNQDVNGDELTMDKTRAAVKDLYAQILVAIRSAETISKRIQKLSDEELLPQIVELLKGLTQNWKIMLESHETQKKILVEVKSFASCTYGKFCNDSHRLATLQLEAELLHWRSCFTEYVTAQKAYVEALHNWLTKFLAPEVEFCSRSRSRNSSTPYRANGPPLLLIFHDWLASMEKLPYKPVAFALKSFSKDVRALWSQQGEEQAQKRKVDGLAKELDKKTLAFQKAETRFVETKHTDMKSEAEVDHQNEYLVEKKEQLDIFRRKMEVEKEKHHNCMQETQRVTLNGLQTGFSSVFESLTEFSKASLKMYNDLVTCSENASRVEDPSYIECSKAEQIT